MDDLKIDAVCMNVVPGEVKMNLDRIHSFAREASAKGANMICFPEFSVTGYLPTPSKDLYRGVDVSYVTERLVRIAKKAGLVLVAGIIEFANRGKPYITQVVTGPEGLIGFHRKTHLSPPEANIYQAGDEIKIFSYGGSTFGVLLCYEAHFPEISTTMALMGANLLLIPHASPRGNPQEKLESWLRHLKARAFDNSVFVVACNQVGNSGERLSFPGVSVVLGPDGHVMAEYTGEEEHILFVELEADLLHSIKNHRMKYFLPKRRPELYGKISTV